MDVAVPEPARGADGAETFVLLDDFYARFRPDGRREQSRRGARRRAAVGVSAACSMLIHAALALTFLQWVHNEQGVLQQPTDAISIELTASEVLEQAQPETQDKASGTKASAAQKAGTETDSAQATPADVKPAETVVAETATDSVATVAATPAPAEQVVTAETVIAGSAEVADAPPPPAAKAQDAEETKAKPTEPEPKPSEREKTKADKRPATKPGKTESRQSSKGGAPSRTSAASKPGSGKVSASAGDVSAYAARVRARVASRRPAARGGRGTAVVNFGVSPSGGLRYARLVRSSGVAALDQAAMAAVRDAAPFPPPPAGVQTSSLSFTFPFYFQ